VTAAPLRLAVLPDYREEGWPSMDLCADMLLANLPADVAGTVVRPRFVRAAGRILGQRPAGFNADRVLNRHLLYPRFARRHAADFEAYHVVDHSYAQLLHALPAGRTGVYCYDLDAFRCLVDQAADPRPRWFRALARRTLGGLQKAAVVFLISAAVGADLRRLGLVDPDRLRLVPLGVAPEFTAEAPAGAVPPAWLADLGDAPVIAHVGSGIPRKRIDVLLDVTAAVRTRVPNVRLVKVGGEFTPAHRDQIRRLGLADALVHRTGLTRAELAAVYRRADVVLVPSKGEGFGLPVIEALACGAAVVATDLTVLHEAGGPAADYAPLADIPAWTELVCRRITAPREVAAVAGRLTWAARFTWAAHAQQVAAEYRRLAGRA